MLAGLYASVGCIVDALAKSRSTENKNQTNAPTQKSAINQSTNDLSANDGADAGISGKATADAKMNKKLVV